MLRKVIIELVLFAAFSVNHVLAQDVSVGSAINWVLLLLVFILTSAIGAFAGIILLIWKPVIADPPLFKDPMLRSEPIPTSYRQFPLEYEGMRSGEEYPLEIRNEPDHLERYRENIQVQEL